MEFFRQEYWNGKPFPSPGNLPNPGIEPGSPVLQADSLPSEPPGKPSYWPYLAATFSLCQNVLNISLFNPRYFTFLCGVIIMFYLQCLFFLP